MVEAVGEICPAPQFLFRQIEPADWLRAKLVWPKVRAVANALDLAAGVPVEAVVGGAHDLGRPVVTVAGEVPFTDHAGGVAGVAQPLGQGNVIGRQAVFGVGPEVIQNAHPRRVLAGEKRRTIWRANRGRGVGLGEPQAALGQAIEVRGLVEVIAVTAQLRPAKVVSQNENDVGALGLKGLREGQGKQGTEPPP